jgi:hypothetical protein
MELMGTDILARHALEKGHKRADNTVKPKAFQPANDGATSVFKITGLAHEEVKQIGEEYVATPRQKPLLGWSQIGVQNVIDAGLNPDPDNEPPRHVNIIGWPEDKGKQLMIQTELAANAVFIPA